MMIETHQPSTPTSPAVSAPLPAVGLNRREQRVLALLGRYTYEQVEQKTGWSRGKIYNLALRMGARKTEARIRERSDERRRRQLAFLAETINTTAKADVLDFLDALPTNSVALHLTSVPYNTGKSYGDCAGADRMRFGYFSGWLKQIVCEQARTLKPNGVLFLNLGSTYDWQNQLLPLDILLFEDIRMAGLTFQSRIIWELPHGLTPKKRLSERHETILVFSKGDSPVFNPTPGRFPQKYPGKRAFKGRNKGRLSGHPLGAHPSNVWRIPNVGHNHPERKYAGNHPAPFPLALARRGILIYSMPGDLVCDCFSGSGTTHEAAVQTGRAFVGADLFYENERAARLANAVPDLVSALPGVSDESLAIWQAEAQRIDSAAVSLTADQEAKVIQDTFEWK